MSKKKQKNDILVSFFCLFVYNVGMIFLISEFSDTFLQNPIPSLQYIPFLSTSLVGIL